MTEAVIRTEGARQHHLQHLRGGARHQLVVVTGGWVGCSWTILGRDRQRAGNGCGIIRGCCRGLIGRAGGGRGGKGPVDGGVVRIGSVGDAAEAADDGVAVGDKCSQGGGFHQIKGGWETRDGCGNDGSLVGEGIYLQSGGGVEEQDPIGRTILNVILRHPARRGVTGGRGGDSHCVSGNDEITETGHGACGG